MNFNTLLFCQAWLLAIANVDALLKTKRDRPQVTVRGNAFFAGGERFYVRGVDYQPGT
jgi:hypothetical protein